MSSSKHGLLLRLRIEDESPESDEAFPDNAAQPKRQYEAANGLTPPGAGVGRLNAYRFGAP